MTELEALKLVAVLTTALPRDWSFLTPSQRKDTGAIYVRMLADLPYPAANAAVESLLASATHMPTIAEVRAATLRATHGDARPGGDAWGDVLRLTSYRDDADITGIDQLALYVCERMGWVKRRVMSRRGADVKQWCVARGDNESADRARFIELYEQLASKRRHEANVSQLPAAQRYRALQAATKPQIAAGAQR
ncbi:MAG TPA: hypothetical protein VHV78_02690, partial [Gemmatimonadaceae bacterium]|nr:hypothetical protein [Gemmatimonadaceae bacterium]